jgi:hypothetical protein
MNQNEERKRLEAEERYLAMTAEERQAKAELTGRIARWRGATLRDFERDTVKADRVAILTELYDFDPIHGAADVIMPFGGSMVAYAIRNFVNHQGATIVDWPIYFALRQRILSVWSKFLSADELRKLEHRDYVLIKSTFLVDRDYEEEDDLAVFCWQPWEVVGPRIQAERRDINEADGPFDRGARKATYLR